MHPSLIRCLHLALSVLALVLVFWCSPAAAGSIDRLGLTPASADHVEAFEGDTAVVPVDGGLMIAVDGAERDATFFYYSEDASPLSEALRDEQATVLRGKVHLELILPAHASILRLGLPKPEVAESSRLGASAPRYRAPWSPDERAAAEARYGISTFIEDFSGYELTYFAGSAGRPAAADLVALSDAELSREVVPRTQGLFHDYPDYPGGSGYSCQSGGNGATSCSVGCEGGCSTECGAGYYACCNCSPPRCRCERNP